ncbi:MAG: hypothetical protein K2I48_02325, partial [Muribaculaceae bacterium]|nr:hypothetical protein [Muribaculaceae bacterium]
IAVVFTCKITAILNLDQCVIAETDTINQRLLHMDSRIDRRLSEHDNQIEELSDKVDFILRTSLPPKEGILTGKRGALAPRL